MNIIVRTEREEDLDPVYEVVRSAFENAERTNGDEQNFVNRIRNSEAFIPELSLVAEHDGRIIGHVLFTKIKIGDHSSLTLAPLSVVPEYQRKGVGGRLILEGHRIARILGFRSVIVVGHHTYYPRFGYAPASQWRIEAPFDVPNESFMALELVEGGLSDVSGMVEFPKEFFESDR
jgi:predicted N-acetyltransferase YhbS